MIKDLITVNSNMSNIYHVAVSLLSFVSLILSIDLTQTSCLCVYVMQENLTPPHHQ